MGSVAEMLHLISRPGLRRDTRVLGHRFGDGGVEAAIQCLELRYRDRGPVFLGQGRDGLADVAVVVHHLGHVEPSSQQLPAMQRRGRANGVRGKRGGRPLQTKRLRDLSQEERHPALELQG
jgi:hypothetical protein